MKRGVEVSWRQFQDVGVSRSDMECERNTRFVNHIFGKKNTLNLKFTKKKNKCYKEFLVLFFVFFCFGKFALKVEWLGVGGNYEGWLQGGWWLWWWWWSWVVWVVVVC